MALTQKICLHSYRILSNYQYNVVCCEEVVTKLCNFQVQQESNGGEMNSEGIQTSTLTLTEPDEDMIYTCVVTSGLYPDSPEGKVNVLLSLLNQPGLLMLN